MKLVHRNKRDHEAGQHEAEASFLGLEAEAGPRT